MRKLIEYNQYHELLYSVQTNIRVISITDNLGETRTLTGKLNFYAIDLQTVRYNINEKLRLDVEYDGKVIYQAMVDIIKIPTYLDYTYNAVGKYNSCKQRGRKYDAPNYYTTKYKYHKKNQESHEFGKKYKIFTFFLRELTPKMMKDDS